MHLNSSVKSLDAALSNGADFAEIFAEESYSSELSMVDSKPSRAIVGKLHGAGIRVFYGFEQIYVTTNDLSEAGLLKAAKTAAQVKKGTAHVGAQEFQTVPFDDIHTYGQRPSEYDREKKFKFLQTMDRSARARSHHVVQVEPTLVEKTQKILVANSLGIWAEDERNYVRAMVSVLLEDLGVKQGASERAGTLGTSEYFETLNFEQVAHDAVDRAVLLIHADYAPAGEMPVIIDKRLWRSDFP